MGQCVVLVEMYRPSSSDGTLGDESPLAKESLLAIGDKDGRRLARRPGPGRYRADEGVGEKGGGGIDVCPWRRCRPKITGGEAVAERRLGFDEEVKFGIFKEGWPMSY